MKIQCDNSEFIHFFRIKRDNKGKRLSKVVLLENGSLNVENNQYSIVINVSKYKNEYQTAYGWII